MNILIKYIMGNCVKQKKKGQRPLHYIDNDGQRQVIQEDQLLLVGQGVLLTEGQKEGTRPPMFRSQEAIE